VAEVAGSTAWYAWCDASNSTASSSAAGTTYTACSSGVHQILGYNWVAALSAAERERREADRRRREAERQAAIRERAEAEQRAERLLLDHLSERQRAEYRERRAFTVISADGERTYRIERGWSGNVKLIGPDGRECRRYCIHPRERVPTEDCMLAQKLLIENDEPAFLRVANAS
jgi:hypothetical protein